MKLQRAKKLCEEIVTVKFNNDYSIDSTDRDAIKTILEELDRLQNEHIDCTLNHISQYEVIRDYVPVKKIDNIIEEISKKYLTEENRQKDKFTYLYNKTIVDTLKELRRLR